MLIVSTMGSIGFLTHPVHPKPSRPGLRESTVLQDQSASEFAAAFTRAWLTWPVGETAQEWQSQMQPFVASSVLGSSFPGPVSQGKTTQVVEAVFPIRLTRRGPKEFLVDVYAETNLHPLIHLTVPVSFDTAGHPAVINPPIVKPVSHAGAINTAPTASSAPDAVSAALRPVVVSFLQAYLSGQTSADLTNFVAPGTNIEPLGGLFTWKSLTDLQVLGHGPYTAIVSIEVLDPAAKVEISQTYALSMIQNSGKWFISSLAP
ncbi:conjugal transfer protein [Alicyclobacillus curvatus]|nr:conjugal transfer protein [Alicyclobacillus curvatus]